MVDQRGRPRREVIVLDVGEDQVVITGGQLLSRFGVEELDPEEVVAIFELAFLNVETPAIAEAALSDDDALTSWR